MGASRDGGGLLQGTIPRNLGFLASYPPPLDLPLVGTPSRYFMGSIPSGVLGEGACPTC